MPISLPRIVLMVTLLLVASEPGLCDDNVPQSSGGSEVLELRLPNTPQPNYGVPNPEQVTGRVTTKNADNSIVGVEGVTVTDGHSVTTTNPEGRYTLKPDSDAVFIHVTKPSGFAVVGDWYAPVNPEVNFELTAATRSEDSYIFVHVTDTHVSKSVRSQSGLSRFVREVNDLSPQPHFVVNSGDLLDLHKALVTTPEHGRADFRSYVGIMNNLEMPHYNVAGDHTDSSYKLDQFPRGDFRCGKPLYWENLGPNFFSFEYGSIHFMSVDFGYHLGRRQVNVGGRVLEYPTNHVQPMHANWMRQDMATRSPGTFVVTTSEADLGDHCTGFLKLAKEQDVRLQLVGDTHILSEKKRAVPYRTGGALAGCWWNPKTEQRCPDLSPQGYLIYRVVGETIDYFYKGLGKRISIVSHRIAAPLTGRVKIEAHLVQPINQEGLEYSFDGTDWSPMKEVGQPFYRKLYSAEIDTTKLPDGISTLHVKSTRGEVETRDFVVANGSRSTASSDATLSFSVGTQTGWTDHKAPDARVDVLINDHPIGTLVPNEKKAYSFDVPAAELQTVNVLSFRFTDPADGMSLSSPILTVGGEQLYDPRDQMIRRIRINHWGKDAADWGGFIAGEAAPADESPFHRRQDEFCFVLGTETP